MDFQRQKKMSKLEELIAKLCPNGVEYKKIAETTTMLRGVRLVRNELEKEGKYPVYQNSMSPLGYYKEYNCNRNRHIKFAAYKISCVTRCVCNGL